MQEGSYANKKTSLTLPSNGTTALQSREERISKIEALFFIPGEESAPLSFLGTIAFTAAAREREVAVQTVAKGRERVHRRRARRRNWSLRVGGRGTSSKKPLDRPAVAACAGHARATHERERASCGRRRPRGRPPPKIECKMLT